MSQSYLVPSSDFQHFILNFCNVVCVAGHKEGNTWEIIIIYLLTAIGLSPASSGYFTRKQNMKLITNKFKSGGLHEKHVVATWNLGNHLSICL